MQWVLTQLDQAQIKPAKILEVGCGTGRPVCAEFAAAGHDVLGIDVSSVMLEAACKRVPQAKFEQMDVRDFSAPSATFDAITVYFSLIVDITPDEIRQCIQNIFDWLKPGGVFVFATVPIAAENVEIRFMGKPVIVSGLDSEDALGWMRKVGFEVVRDAVSKFKPKGVEAGICGPEDVEEEEQLVVCAKKPAS
ncbi:MAG: hypothetical protein M1816_002975 [Peltula sp. TS41687]|nr:MAG: hypothetical protein M1816_002975 [Peltula sp. TS41687]